MTSVYVQNTPHGLGDDAGKVRCGFLNRASGAMRDTFGSDHDARLDVTLYRAIQSGPNIFVKGERGQRSVDVDRMNVVYVNRFNGKRLDNNRPSGILGHVMPPLKRSPARHHQNTASLNESKKFTVALLRAREDFIQIKSPAVGQVP